jgi:hypothetical protein
LTGYEIKGCKNKQKMVHCIHLAKAVIKGDVFFHALWLPPFIISTRPRRVTAQLQLLLTFSLIIWSTQLKLLRLSWILYLILSTPPSYWILNCILLI